MDNNRLRKITVKKKKRLILWIIGIIIIVPLFLYQQNNAIGITSHMISSDRLPESFDGFRILQISDLHNKSFGHNQSRLIDKIKSADFDIIVITGDIADARRYDPEPVYTLIPKLTAIAPTYYVTGNHESDIGDYDRLEGFMKTNGVTVLRNTSVLVSRGGASIVIAGIDDPTMHFGTGFDATLIELASYESGYTILLSHRPEKMALYSALNYDLVFSGHAHGGQFRLPFLGGVIAPHQGFFPKYSEGVHIAGETALVVSRGLGNSLFPFRLFNPPELVLVTLESSK